MGTRENAARDWKFRPCVSGISADLVPFSEAGRIVPFYPEDIF